MSDSNTARGALEPAQPREGGPIEAYRGYLMRFALLQLRDRAAAEDVVQETLLAALQSGTRFAGRSSVKTWLTGILKHKIVDHLRTRGRELQLADAPGQAAEAETAEALFVEDGHWRERCSDWGEPERSFESAEFWKVFEMCVHVMPVRAARVFVMREILDMPTEEICKALAISTTNCWVLLHRARLALRECLQTKWFNS